MGMDFEPHLATGLLELRLIDPAELSPGEFASRVSESVEQRHARIIVIDSLNGYLNAMPSEKFLLIQMHELLMYLGKQGVVTLLVMAQHGLMGSAMSTPVDVSFLADTVILLRYFEAIGEVRQAISVVKKRRSGHERTIRELRLGSTGVSIGEPLRDFHGVLTGVPTYSGAEGPLISEARQKGRSGINGGWPLRCRDPRPDSGPDRARCTPVSRHSFRGKDVAGDLPRSGRFSRAAP